MTLTPAVYLVVLAAVVFLYWALPYRYDSSRALLLVAASSAVVFLTSPTAFFVAVATASVASYISGILAARPSTPLFVTAVLLVICILIMSRVAPSGGQSIPLIDLTGSAFFCLKAIAVLADAQRFSRATRPLDALLLILFFPIYEAGPIERPSTLNREKCYAPFDPEMAITGIGRILVGLAKQAYLGPVLIAGLLERLSPWNAGSSDASFGLLVLWILLKWAQIYIMFSGYSDVAIGSAGLFAIKIRENFNFPFLAKNLQDFWQRWHMTLIDFMSNYVYQPFVRKTGWRYRGLVLLFIATGLWHAFNLQYLLWGMIHGGTMAAIARWQRSDAGRRFKEWTVERAGPAIVVGVLVRVSTLIFVAWVSAIGSSETWTRALYVLTLGMIAS